MELLSKLSPDQLIFVAYAAIGIMAITPIYFGAYRSLKFDKKKDTDVDEEFFSLDDAKMFPFIGSASLLSLYIVFKYLDKDLINYVVTAYFTGLGIVTTIPILLEISRYVSGMELKGNYLLSLHGKEKEKELYSIEKFYIYFGYYHLFLAAIASVIGVYYAVTKHWLVSNFYGEAFAISAIELLNLESFKTGLLLLGGLFFYDIFWVFGTDVMVTVAKNFDAPIKVVFPKDIVEVIRLGLFSRTEKVPFTLLGLGDIVIPGIFVALCLQFDFHLYKKSLKGKKVPKDSSRFNFPTPYFNACFFAYILGLFTTVFIMHNFKAAQPALLYLSPACSISAVLVAVIKGQTTEFFNFDPKGDREAGEEKKVVTKEEKELLSPKTPKKAANKKKDDGLLSDDGFASPTTTTKRKYVRKVKVTDE